MRWLKSLEAFLRRHRKDDRAWEVSNGQSTVLSEAILSLLAALLLCKEAAVKKQAIETAACLPEVEPLLGFRMLPLLVYALQETMSGIVSIS